MPLPRIENSIRIAGCSAVIAIVATLAIPVDEETHEAVDEATFGTTEADTPASLQAGSTRCADTSGGEPSTVDPAPRPLAENPSCDADETAPAQAPLPR